MRAPQVEVCCFDKTGTLTSDHLLLEEVVVGSEEDRPVAQRVMATCHSLVQVSVAGCSVANAGLWYVGGGVWTNS